MIGNKDLDQGEGDQVLRCFYTLACFCCVLLHFFNKLGLASNSEIVYCNFSEAAIYVCASFYINNQHDVCAMISTVSCDILLVSDTLNHLYRLPWIRMAPREASGAAVVCCRRGRKKGVRGAGVAARFWIYGQMKMRFSWDIYDTYK